MVARGIRAFEYAIGDEVVVRLMAVRAFDLTAGRAVRRDLPVWTIADVAARLERHAGHLYAIRFRLDDAICIALVSEDAIEGLA